MLDSTDSAPPTHDETLTVLTDRYCRSVLHYFRYHSTKVATSEALGAFVHEQHEAPTERVERSLHHATLPRLADVGLLEYDTRSQTARYRGEPRIEQWLNHVVEHGEALDDPS